MEQKTPNTTIPTTFREFAEYIHPKPTEEEIQAVEAGVIPVNDMAVRAHARQQRLARFMANLCNALNPQYNPYLHYKALPSWPDTTKS